MGASPDDLRDGMESDFPGEGSRVAPVRRGRRLGRYLLCYELASGGMATVFLARADGPAGFEKLVAVKVIHPHLAKEREFVEMFLDEARIAAKIVHPNVCTVFDFGQADDTYYIAMEYLVGETVSRLMRVVAKRPEEETRRWPAIAARIVADACEGLHAAHELVGPDGASLHVVHRDVTPQNLFVGYDGAVRVVDFGVASAADRMHHTTAGQLKGKYAYMSPEQVRQRPVDRRADVWSLGVCLWEMLAARRLFRRTNEFETLKAVLEAPIPTPSSIQPAIPEALDAVVMSALTRDPDERYESARELAKALNTVAASLGGAAVADVGELMHALFEEERQQRLELLDEVRSVDAFSSSLVAPSSKLGFPPEPSSASRVSAPPSTRPTEDDAPARSRGWLWAALAVVLLGVGIGAGGLVLFGPQAEPREPIAAPAPAVLEAPRRAAAPPAPEVVPAAPAEETEEPPEEAAPAPAPEEPARERVRRPPRPRPDRPVGEGVVNVVTPPGWADIYVGRRRVGRSPSRVTLPAGRRTLRLMPYGEGPPIVRSVNVPADGVTRLSVRLP